MFQAVCPTCRQKAVPPFHKIAATVDTLVPAQCANCKAYSTVPPERIAWLGFPELSALPVGALVFFVTERLYLAFGVGVLVYCAAVVIGVSRAPLSAFLPENTSRLASFGAPIEHRAGVVAVYGRRVLRHFASSRRLPQLEHCRTRFTTRQRPAVAFLSCLHPRLRSPPVAHVGAALAVPGLPKSCASTIAARPAWWHRPSHLTWRSSGPPNGWRRLASAYLYVRAS